MIATSGFLAALQCTKFVFGSSFALDPAGGAYSAALPRLYSWFKGDLLLRGMRREGGRGEEGRGQTKGGERRRSPLLRKFPDPPAGDIVFSNVRCVCLFVCLFVNTMTPEPFKTSSPNFLNVISYGQIGGKLRKWLYAVRVWCET